jgi:hypothetical protein
MNSHDHWPQANTALIAGGGMRLGQVIGRTNKVRRIPVDRPVKFQEVSATLYSKAGLNWNTAAVSISADGRSTWSNRATSRSGN